MKKSTHTEILSESLIPNSVAYKKSNLDKAHEMLEVAKSIPRIVRKAKPNECDFSRERERLLNAEPRIMKVREDGLISVKDAVEFYGLSQFTIQDQRKKGLIPFKKEHNKYYYDPADLMKIEPRRKYKNNNEDQVA